MVDLKLHDPGNLAVALGAAPDHAFRPQGVFAQFVDGGMIVVIDLIRQRQVGRIEDAGLAAHEAQKARGLLDAQAGKGPIPQRAIEQQDTRRMIVRAEAERRLAGQVGRVERGQVVGIGQVAEAGHQQASFLGAVAGK
ncbi:hypothetical protein D3C72_1665840 [compost metagenome]